MTGVISDSIGGGALNGRGGYTPITVYAGQWTLSGNNTYSGATAVVGGTLTLDSPVSATTNYIQVNGTVAELNINSAGAGREPAVSEQWHFGQYERVRCHDHHGQRGHFRGRNARLRRLRKPEHGQ